MTYSNHQTFNHASPSPVRRTCAEGHQFTSTVHTLDHTTDGSHGIKTMISLHCGVHCPYCQNKRYFGSQLKQEDLDHEFQHEKQKDVNGVIFGRSGWHFTTEDEDTYGPYDTQEECVTASWEYAKQL